MYLHFFLHQSLEDQLMHAPSMRRMVQELLKTYHLKTNLHYFQGPKNKTSDIRVVTNIYLHLLPEPGVPHPLLAWEENYLLAQDPWNQLSRKA